MKGGKVKRTSPDRITTLSQVPPKKPLVTPNEIKDLRKEIKNKDDERGDFVTLKQYARTRDGSTRSISVKDSERNPFPNSKRVGNGSKVNASYRPVPYTQYGGGVKGYLNAVQVVDLIEYNADDFDIVKGGYVSEDTDDLAFAS